MKTDLEGRLKDAFKKGDREEKMKNLKLGDKVIFTRQAEEYDVEGMEYTSKMIPVGSVGIVSMIQNYGDEIGVKVNNVYTEFTHGMHSEFIKRKK